MLRSSFFALALLAASSAANAGSCVPSVVFPEDIWKLVAAGGAGGANGEAAARRVSEMIQSGRLVIINREVLAVPEIQKVLSREMHRCIERSLGLEAPQN